MNKVAYFVYHYELTNDNRYLLMFEPNIFDCMEDAKVHCSALQYLSGRPFLICKESDINKLPLISNDCDYFHFVDYET